METESPNWYASFLQQNKTLIFTHILITILQLPLEIWVYSFFSKKIFKAIQDKKYPLLARYIILFIFFVLLLQLISSFRYYVDGKLRGFSQIYIRQTYMNYFLEKNDEDFTNTECIHQMDSVPDSFFQFYNSFLLLWIPLFGICFFFTLFCFWLHKGLGISAFLFFSLFLTVLILCFQKISDYANEVYHLNENILENYENILSNNESIRSGNTKEVEITKLTIQENLVFQNNSSLNVYVNSLQFSLLFLLCLFFIGSFIFIYKYSMKNPVYFYKFIIYCSVTIFCLNNIVSKLNMLYRVIVEKGSLQTLDNVSIYRPEKDKVVQLDNYNIEIKNLTFERENQTILKNLNFYFPEKSTILIKGSIGSGKSTFMKLLLGWYQPTKGIIRIGNHSLPQLSLQLLRKTIYMMSQKTILFSNRTVLENIFYPNPVQIEKIEPLPLPLSFQKIFHKNVIKQGTNISGGQKRIIHVLRAWLNPAPIIILDEPVDNIDPKTLHIVQDIITEIHNNKTLICISHIDVPIPYDQLIDFDQL